MTSSPAARVRLRPRDGTAVVPTVLWAEDNLQDQRLIQEAVIGADPVRLKFAADGVHALAAVRQQRPDLLVLDLRMPRMGGLDALRQVRLDPRLSDLRVCVFSAGNQPEEVHACRSFGALAVVQKPVDFDAFEKAVQQILLHARPLAVA
jgi:CheY-like chemotaxis protein